MLAIYFFLAILLVSVCSENTTLYYDSFHGARINDTKVREHVRKNTTFWCVTKFEPCDPDEPRRIDGTCNNLENPTRGASHTPFYRVLPPIYEEENNYVFEPRTAEDGDPLPPPRPLRTSFLPVGRVPDQVFTQLATHYIVFTAADVVSLHDTVNYILWTPHCCDAKGKTDKTCVPMKVPEDDPVHRFSNVRCLNLTRPDTFQSQKCIENGTAPERIISSTPLVDLSHMYGNDLEALEKKGRKFEGGLLKYEEEDGRVWPPSTTGPVDLCLLNAHPVETRCHNTPEDGTNTLIGINLVSIWLWRMHNRIASALSEINSCWDDNQLFYKARDINIAMSTQILYYELLPLLMGRNNLILDNVIASSPTFRDIYNETEVPQVSLEYPFVLRWFHMMQEGELRMYDTDGHYLKQFPVVNLTLKTGYLALDDNLDWITQGSFRQPSGKVDYVVDPDIADLVLGPHQRASDVFASDLSKNRLFGFQPYVKYLEFCFNRPYKSFNDLAELFDPERLELLRDKYKHVNDIDLMAGMWLEKLKDGGFIPPTLYCLMTDQLLRNIVTDRHWYERPNRPHAFTLEQLLEIRKSSISALLCEVGDTVTEIQPSGFLRAGPRNEIDSCDLLPKIDFNAWKDESCDRDRRRRRSNY